MSNEKVEFVAIHRYSCQTGSEDWQMVQNAYGCSDDTTVKEIFDWVEETNVATHVSLQLLKVDNFIRKRDV